MGYTTDFIGEFELDKPLSEEHKAYLDRFANVRHFKRDVNKLGNDPIREAVNLPVGDEGEYYVADDNQNTTLGHNSNYNYPPKSQPGLYCQWIPSEDGQYIQWDEGEKFYYYIEYLVYIRDHFLIPWGYNLNGEVQWQGEDPNDRGIIEVNDNNIRIKRVVITYEYDESYPVPGSNTKGAK